jgi:hypothetical protein
LSDPAVGADAERDWPGSWHEREQDFPVGSACRGFHGMALREPTLR